MLKAATLLPVLVTLLAPSAFAAPTLRVEGRLADAQGRPVTGLVRLDFRLVDKTTREEFWSETLEVAALRGVYTATLGLGQRLPAPRSVKDSWRLSAVAPLDSGLAAGPLTSPEDDERRLQLAKLLVRLGKAPDQPLPIVFPQYKKLLTPETPSIGALPEVYPPPKPAEPGCGEGAAADGSGCPARVRKVLDREERLLLKKLEKAAAARTGFTSPRW